MRSKIIFPDNKYKASQLIIPSDTWYSNPDTGISSPEKLHDGRWSGTSNYATIGGSTAPYLITDLQYPRILSHIEYVLYCGDNRAYYGVSLATSLDGTNWNYLVYTPQSQLRQSYWGPHYVNAKERLARYVRFETYGSTANAGNHLDELMIYELVNQEDIP